MVRDGKRKGRFKLAEIEQAFGEWDESVRESLAEESAEEALAQAEAAREEYDYERARNLYKLAVVLSEGEAESVCRMATFLVDDYAMFDEAIALLEAESCDISGLGLRLLARAHYMAGHKEEALAVYEVLNESDGDFLSRKRHGRLLMDLARPGEAVRVFERAMAMDNSDRETQQLRDACQMQVKDAIALPLQQAEAELAAERAPEASALLDGLMEYAWLPPEYYRVRNQVKARLTEAQLTSLLEQAASVEQSGELSQALDLYREALQVDESCELAREKTDELSNRLEGNAAQQWLSKGLEALAADTVGQAVSHFFMAVTRDRDIETTDKDGALLLGMVREFHEEYGRMPGESQRGSLAAAYRAVEALARGEVAEAQSQASRSGSLMEQLSAGRTFKERMAGMHQAREAERARKWFMEAQTAQAAGRFAEAVSLFERAARVKGFDKAAEAERTAQSLQERLDRDRDRNTTMTLLDQMVADERYFVALREMRKGEERFQDDPVFAELRQAAQRGVHAKYPMAVTVLPPRPLADPTNYRTGSDGFEAFDAEQTRAAAVRPGAAEWWVLAGRQLALLDGTTGAARLRVELPPQADLTDKKGFILADIGPGDVDSLVVVDFDDDMALYFQHSRNQVDLVNAMPLGRHLQQTRHKVTRWYTLNGPEEELVVCQSAPGQQPGSRLYSLSLYTGRIEHDETFSYTLGHVRRVPGPEGSRFVVHRHPEPIQMRRPGYFSYAFLDGRQRFVERRHFSADELDGIFVESMPFFRTGPQSGNRYHLFRYFDAFTGQLVGRPLAFVATNPEHEILYSAPDSSHLVADKGDLDPQGEVIVVDGKEILAIVGRKENDPKLFFLDLARFKLLEVVNLEPDLRIFGLARAPGVGRVAVVGVDKETGSAAIEYHEFSA